MSTELRDVYTKEGVSQRRAVEKHRPASPGEYFKHVLVILKTEDSPAPGTGTGRYVMQQRSLKARHFAGMWDATGGGVRSGETEAPAAVREVREELGISLQEDKLAEAWRFVSEWDNDTGLLVTVFACRMQPPEGGFSYDPMEVNDVKIVPFHEFARQMRTHNDDAFIRELKKVEETL